VRPLNPIALSKEAFAPFGDVVEVDGARHFTINQGFAERYNDLAWVETAAEAGSVNISIVVASPRPEPIAIAMMERHPLGSQIFYPLQDQPWLVVVCGDPHDGESYRAFLANGRQGVNYARNTWHHPLLVREKESRFLVVDRKGPGDNLEEIRLAPAEALLLKP
jgi:ureidoglycolate lyase